MPPRIMTGKPLPPRKGGRKPTEYVATLARLKPGQCFPMPEGSGRLRSRLYDYARRHGFDIAIRRDEADSLYCFRLPMEAAPEVVPVAQPLADLLAEPDTPFAPAAFRGEIAAQPPAPPELTAAAPLNPTPSTAATLADYFKLPAKT